MVNSRCVEGLSTGIRPVSAMATNIRANKANTKEGLSTKPSFKTWAIAPDKLVVEAVMVSVKIAINMAGSAIEEMVISLDEPMPPNAVPISNPAKARKKRAKAKKPTITITSALAEVGRSTAINGTTVAANTVAENII